MAELHIVEIVRRNTEAWVHGDFREAARYIDRDVVYDISRHSPEGLVFEGSLGLLEGLQLFEGAFEEFERELVELMQADAERVVVITRQRGRGAGSGVDVEQVAYAIETVRDGKIARIDIYPSAESAFAATGLDPSRPPVASIRIARQGYEAFAARDVAGFIGMLADDLDWRPPPDSPHYESFEGPGGALREIEEFTAGFSEYDYSPRYFVAFGDVVVAFGSHRAVGAASGLEVSESETHVMRMRDGKIRQMFLFRDEDEALREAGLVGG